ncbi:hypothetical protein TL16_g01565 [Triparma laevis f. inornata]|uniref:Suppressor of anucleate metulae protein B n=1 Tax=Triparma laevis f. inornata TaxID=1714386 RepID=A0A9W7DX58_9STRA|nr:hypothetical protein TL16_g01565 [Triparma laevis f. inornata]
MSSNTTQATTSCFVCSKPTTNLCSRCLKASFCSPTCQQSSWSSHKLVCASKVHIGLTSAGQTVYASVSVPNPGDIILLEKPLLVSGKIEFEELTKVLDSLPDPKLNAFFNLTSVHNGDTGYGLLSLSEKVKSAKECFNNMALRRKRGANPDPALEHQECVNMYNLQQSIIGILRTNTIPMLPSEPNCSMLCSILCRINHSCEPNATYSYRADFKKSVLVALKPIQEGEEIFVSYIDCWFSRDERLARLKDNFCFDCDCVRCAEDRYDNITDRGR